MKMAKKVLAVVLAALIAAAVFAGCSKDEKKTNAPAAEKVKVINIDLSDEVYALGVNKDDADLLAKTTAKTFFAIFIFSSSIFYVLTNKQDKGRNTLVL